MRSAWARTAKVGCTAASALVGALGVLLICRPALSQFGAGVMGAALIAFGGMRLIGYFSGDIYRLAFQFDRGLGAMWMALGVLVLAGLWRHQYVLSAVMGVAIMADGMFGAQTAMDARRFGLASWWSIMALALLAGILGAALALRPMWGAYRLAETLGAALLDEAALGACTTLCAVKVPRRRSGDVCKDGK